MLVASQVAPGKPQILHHPMMPDEERIRRHGSGTHTAIEQLVVSEAVTVTFEWTVGENPVAAKGELLVVWNWPFDWSDLQSDDPNGDGLMRVEFEPANGRDAADVQLAPRYNWIAGIEPWHHQIQVRVSDGELRPGDRVRLICGDMTGGGGWRAPTCAADRCRFLMLIDHNGDGTRNRLVQQPGFRVVAGPAVRLAAVAESDAVVNEPLRLIVRAEDCWGNPTQIPERPVVTADPPSSEVQVEPVERQPVRPAFHFRVTASEPGTIRLKAQAGGLSSAADPTVVHQTAPEQRLFWGDLHSGQTEIGCGCGSIAESYAFGRDCAGIDFMTHQANDHYVTLDDWNHTREVTKEYVEPGRFIPFLGCEWSPLTKDGGDRNVYYRDDDPVLRRSDRFFREDEPDPEPDVRTAPEFHEAFRDRDVLVNIHVGGRMTNLQWYEPKIEKLCETHSTHGTVEWFFMDALSRGYRVGLTAGTDGVMGRPGADHPGRRLIRNLRNGLTAVYAEELTRESLWEALQARRCYATTGPRIRLWFEVDGQPMGSELATSTAPCARFRVQGTTAIERVDLFRGAEIIRSWEVSPLCEAGENPVIRILWGGTERKGTARLQRADWTGSISANRAALEFVDTINFQSSADEARSTNDSRIEWSSSSAGNAAGILVRVRGDHDSELTFDSGPATFSVRVANVLAERHRVDAGGLSRFVEIGRPPASDGPSAFDGEYTDRSGITGELPYWIRVTQVDQSLAWSSPVYVGV